MKKLLKKECRTCKKTKFRKEFRVHIRSNGHENIRPDCRKCEATLVNGRSARHFLCSILAGIRKRANTKLTLDQLENLYIKQNKKCALSGIKLTYIRGNGIVYTNLSVDKINPKLGYTLSNIQLVCRVLNLMKSDIPQTTFITMCKDVYNYNKETK